MRTRETHANPKSSSDCLRRKDSYIPACESERTTVEATVMTKLSILAILSGRGVDGGSTGLFCFFPTYLGIAC